MADSKKLPSTFANMVIVLTVVSLVSALALAITFEGTKKAIAQVVVKRTNAALTLVLPGFDNNPYDERYTLQDPAYNEMEFYPARKKGQLLGTAVKTYSDKGFSGRIWLMIGFDAQNKLTDIAVLGHTETPGLGSKMAESKFKDQFKAKDPAVFQLKVKKDGGEVDAISAATISSRAFCDAAQKAYDALLKGGKK